MSESVFEPDPQVMVHMKFCSRGAYFLGLVA